MRGSGMGRVMGDSSIWGKSQGKTDILGQSTAGAAPGLAQPLAPGPGSSAGSRAALLQAV